MAFSGFAEVVQAPTNDQQALLDALQSLMTGRRTAIGSGILASIDAIAEIDPTVPASHRHRPARRGAGARPGATTRRTSSSLLTDGVSNTGPAPLDAAQQAADRGVRVYTIGFGTADGGALDPDLRAAVPGPRARRRRVRRRRFGGGGGGGGGGFRRGIDDAALMQVADLTGGKYYPAESADQLESVFQSLPTYLITKHEVVELSVGFVALGALLAGVALLLGRAWRPLP